MKKDYNSDKAAKKITPTPRQLELIEAIKVFLNEHGLPPTRKDLTEMMSIKSQYAIDCLLKNLENKGYIKLIPNVARGILIIQGAMLSEGG